MTRLFRVVAKRLAGAPAALKLAGRDRKRRAVDALLLLAMDRAGVPEQYVPVKIERIDARALAAGLSRPFWYVAAMRTAGYRFRFGRFTTLAHAQEWLRTHPAFSGQTPRPQTKAAPRFAED